MRLCTYVPVIYTHIYICIYVIRASQSLRASQSKTQWTQAVVIIGYHTDTTPQHGGLYKWTTCVLQDISFWRDKNETWKAEIVARSTGASCVALNLPQTQWLCVYQFHTATCWSLYTCSHEAIQWWMKHQWTLQKAAMEPLKGGQAWSQIRSQRTPHRIPQYASQWPPQTLSKTHSKKPRNASREPPQINVPNDSPSNPPSPPPMDGSRPQNQDGIRPEK